MEIEDSGPGRGWALWPQRKDPRKRLGCAKQDADASGNDMGEDTRASKSVPAECLRKNAVT